MHVVAVDEAGDDHDQTGQGGEHEEAADAQRGRVRAEEGVVAVQAADHEEVEDVHERVTRGREGAGRHGDDLLGDVRVRDRGGPDDAHNERQDAQRREDDEHDGEEVSLGREPTPVDGEIGVEVPGGRDGEEEDEDGRDGDVDAFRGNAA